MANAALIFIPSFISVPWNTFLFICIFKYNFAYFLSQFYSSLEMTGLSFEYATAFAQTIAFTNLVLVI